MARGSIQKRKNKDGTYSYRVRVEVAPNPLTGERQWRSGTFRSEKAAEKASREWLTEIDRGMLIVPESLTVGQLVSRWYGTVESNLREKTRYDYQYTIKRYIVPHIGRLRADRIRAADLDAFTAQLKRDGIGDRTRQVALARIKQAYAWACRTGVLAYNPTLHTQPVRVKPKKHTVWSVEDWSRFAAEAGEYLTLFTVFTSTGLRRGEVLGLRWQDFDPQESTLRVRQTVISIGGKIRIQEPKTEAARRTVKIPAPVVELLRDHRRAQVERRLALGPVWQEHDLIFPGPFGGPLHPDAVTRILDRIVKQAGVPRVTVHELRHTHVTWQVLNGAPIPVVSQRLGHTKVSTTMDIYSHLLKDSQDQAVDVIDRLMFGQNRAESLG